MFTANLASSGSPAASSGGGHLRPPEYYVPGHYKSHSNLHLSETGRGSLGGSDEYLRLHSHHHHHVADPPSLLDDLENKSLSHRLKTYAYLLCASSIVIGAIVLIVLAAMGHLNNGR